MGKFAQAGILLLAGLVLGVGLTLWGQSILASKDEVKQAKQTVVNVVDATIQANKDEVKTQGLLDGNAMNIAKLRDKIENRLDQPVTIPGGKNAKANSGDKLPSSEVFKEAECPTQMANGDSYMPFDIGTVRLLNAARRGEPADSVTLTDAESQAFAYITVRVFVANDTEIAKMYNDLAIRHNELVDQVAAFQLKQRKSLNK